MSKVTVNLSDIDKLIGALEQLKSDIKTISVETSKEVAEEGLKYLSKQYSKLYQDDNLTDIKTSIKKTEKGYSIVASGNDVMYAEFGTGDKGENDSHPDKSKYNLNPYNSGGTIMSTNDIKNPEVISILRNKGISGNFWYYNEHNSGRKSSSVPLSDEQKQNRANYLVKHHNEVHITQGVPAGKQMFNTMNKLRNDIIPKVVRKRGKEINDKFIKAIKG